MARYPDSFRPWRCDNGHDLSIDQVSHAGTCRHYDVLRGEDGVPWLDERGRPLRDLCDKPVAFSSTKEEVAEVLATESLTDLPVVRHKDSVWVLHTAECPVCGIIFETVRVSVRYCGSECRRLQYRERLAQRRFCSSPGCTRIIQVCDRRVHYCDPCRLQRPEKSNRKNSRRRRGRARFDQRMTQLPAYVEFAA